MTDALERQRRLAKYQGYFTLRCYMHDPDTIAVYKDSASIGTITWTGRWISFFSPALGLDIRKGDMTEALRLAEVRHRQICLPLKEDK